MAGFSWSSAFLESQQFKKLLLAYDGGPLPVIDSTQADFDSLFTTEDNNANGHIFSGEFTDFIEPGNPLGEINTGIQSFYDLYDCTVTQDNLNQAQVASPLSFVAASDGLYKVKYFGEVGLVNINFPIK